MGSLLLREHHHRKCHSFIEVFLESLMEPVPERWREKKGSRFSLFFFLDNAAPLENKSFGEDEGRADVISDKFFVAFQLGRPRYLVLFTRDTLHREEQAKIRLLLPFPNRVFLFQTHFGQSFFDALDFIFQFFLRKYF